MLYHGVRRTASGCLCRLGAALFDLETAEQCLLRGDSWIFGPETAYKREGDVGYVTFPCGYTLDAGGDGINLYYGAADTSIALAKGASVNSLVGSIDTVPSDLAARPIKQLASAAVQTRTAVADRCPYTQNMQTDVVKAALTGSWVLAVLAFGYMSGTSSFAGWALLAVVSLAPLLLMVRLWSAPPPTMSETIRNVLR